MIATLINLEYREGTKDQDNEKKKKTQLSDSIVAEITHIHVACDEEREERNDNRLAS